MSYDPPEELSLEEEAIVELADELKSRLDEHLVETYNLSSYDTGRILADVAKEFESLDLSHSPATAAYRLVKRREPQDVANETERDLFEEAVRGELYGKTQPAHLDNIVDEIMKIHEEHPW